MEYYVAIKNNKEYWGTWVAQLSDRLLVLAQVMISWFMSSSTAVGLYIMEPASDSLSPFISAPPLLSFSISLSPSHSQHN